MTTDKNKVSELLVSAERVPCGEKIVCYCGGCIAFDMEPDDPEWVRDKANYLRLGKTCVPAYKGDVMDGCQCGKVISRLRQERDELVGALEEIRSIPLFANSDAEHVFAVQRIAKAILSKHKPE